MITTIFLANFAQFCFHLFKLSFSTYSLYIKKRSSGFTLLELLLVFAVMAILVSMAIPNYEHWVAQQSVDKAGIQLRDHIEFARSYSQTHRVKVEVCPVESSNMDMMSSICSDTSDSNWSAWIVRLPDSNQILVRSEYIPDGIYISSGDRDSFIFNERGGANGYNGTLTVESPQARKSVELSIAADGKILSSEVPVMVGAAASARVSSSQ